MGIKEDMKMKDMCMMKMFLITMTGQLNILNKKLSPREKQLRRTKMYRLITEDGNKVGKAFNEE